jgi:hypothetical protein
MIQMLPSGSLAALETWPNVHPLGMCGQDGSTANFGTLTSDAGLGGAADALCDPTIPNVSAPDKTIPAVTHKLSFTPITLSLSVVLPRSCTTERTAIRTGIYDSDPLSRASYAHPAPDTTNLPHNIDPAQTKEDHASLRKGSHLTAPKGGVEKILMRKILKGLHDTACLHGDFCKRTPRPNRAADRDAHWSRSLKTLRYFPRAVEHSGATMFENLRRVCSIQA